MKQAKTEHDDWVELFAISDHVPPKFWLGDRVKVHDRKGTVIGIEWKGQGLPLLSGGTTVTGWWYCVQWDDAEFSIPSMRVFERLVARADEGNQEIC